MSKIINFIIICILCTLVVTCQGKTKQSKVNDVSINTKQIRELVIRPTLEKIGLYSHEAEELLVATAAQESHMGEYIKQIVGEEYGHANGIYQCEMATHDDIWNNYLKYKPELADKIRALKSEGMSDKDNLIQNFAYATAIARVHYLRFKDPLPKIGDLKALWKIYKKLYNTELGSAKEVEFLINYKKYK